MASAYRKSIDIYDPDAVERLVRRVRGNPDKHYAEFYSAFWTDTYYLAYGILGNTQNAEDVAHEALTRAFDKLDTLDDPRAALKWVRRVVGNAARNHHRDEGRRMAGFHHADTDISEMESYTEVPAALVSTDSSQTFQTSSHHFPDELVMRKEVNQTILGLIEELPSKQRQAIMMYYYAELSTKEIAADLDTTKDAIGALLFRAREALNTRIKEVEKTQNIRLYSVTTLSLSQVLKEAMQTEVELPVARVEATQSASGAIEGTKPLGNIPKIIAQYGVAASLTGSLLLAGGVYALNSNTPDLDDVALSTLDTSHETTQTAKRPASPNTDPKPPADDSPSISDADGSDKPSPVAPAPLYEIVSETQDNYEFSIEFTDPVPPADPEPISNYPRLPSVNSLVHFGTLEGTSVVWEVTARTETTITLTVLQDLPALDGVLTPAERTAILSSVGTTRPTIQIDGHKLTFVIRDGVFYAEPI